MNFYKTLLGLKLLLAISDNAEGAHQDQGNQKFDVCHWSEEDQAFKKISVAGPALDSHLAPVREDIEMLIKEDDEQELRAKFLRMAFHDCVGGCDGCIDLENPENKGLREPIEAISVIVDKYKECYSRADIWALSALTGADLSLIEDRPDGVKFSMRFLGRQDCEAADGMGIGGPDVTMPSNDLTSHGLLTFFHDEFGFTGDEAVAIMGGHAVAVAHRDFIGFGNLDREDGWVFEAEDYKLDNRYYSMLIGAVGETIDASDPFWQLELVENEDGIPSRYQWFHEGTGGDEDEEEEEMMMDDHHHHHDDDDDDGDERPIMTNADMSLVLDFGDHIGQDDNGNEGKVDCLFEEKESSGRGLRGDDTPKACPVADRTIAKVEEYEEDNELFLRDFEKVLDKMLMNGY